MAKTAQHMRGGDDPESGNRPSKGVGHQLRHVRRKQGLSRAEVARSAGLTRRELAAYERGRVSIPDSDLWCLAGSCGVDVAELLPERDALKVDSGLSTLAIGDSIRHLRSPEEPDGALREYMATIYELRNLPPGTTVPLREGDLAALADALGETPEAIEARLVEVVGTDREEAARIRAMILPAQQEDAVDDHDPMARDGGTTASFSAALDGGPLPEADYFFSAPRAEDPFASPPPLEPVAPVGAPIQPLTPADLAPTPALDPIEPIDRVEPLAPLAPIDVAFSPALEPVDAGGPARLDADPDLALDPFSTPVALDDGDMATPGSDADVPPVLATLRPDPFARAGTDATTAGLSPIVPDEPLWNAPEPDSIAPASAGAPSPASLVIAGLDVPVTPIEWHAPDEARNGATVPTPALASTFTDAGPGWEVGGAFPATAMTDDGALALRRADTRWALSDLSAPSDFVAEAVVDLAAGSGFGLLFRAHLDGDSLSGYSFDLDTSTGPARYLLRQWVANEPHWRALAEAAAGDPARLRGLLRVTVSLADDVFTAEVDGERVLTVPSVSSVSSELGLEPCHGDRLGIHAAVTAEVTLDRLSAAQH